MNHPFSSRLRPELRDALAALGFEQPTPIQHDALPHLLDGHDVLGRARTGSGKTVAFGLGILQPLDGPRGAPQALVLCPTRELAEQVGASLRELASRIPHTRIAVTCGGHPIRDQRLALQQGVHVVVGTPGRVQQLLEDGHLDASKIRVFVLDEADRLLDLGFEDSVRAIASHLPEARQSLLFSATWPDALTALTADLLRDPVTVGEEALPEALRQLVVLAEPAARIDALAAVLHAFGGDGAMVFCETRAQCRDVASALADRGAAVLALHGDLDQLAREDVLARFANGSTAVLVATNVAARGLDLPGLALVVNAELPPDPEVYVHRVGRTARAGAAGLAVSLVCGPAEERRLAAIEAQLGAPVPRGERPPDAPRLTSLDRPLRTLLLFGGRRDKLRPGDILGALTRDVGLPGDAVGKIQVGERRTWIAVHRDHLAAAARGLDRGRIKGARFRVEG